MKVLAEVPHGYRPLVEFLVQTGLRVSEAQPLVKADVDFERRRVRITKRLVGAEEDLVAVPRNDERTDNVATNGDAAGSRDQNGGDDQKCAERAEPDRYIGYKRLEIADDEGDQDQAASRKPADAAVFGRQ